MGRHTLYHNTEQDWDYLGEAGRFARYLGLVAPDAFVDMRNPDPLLVVTGPPLFREPVGWRVGELPSWSLPSIETDLTSGISFDLADVTVEGYDYDPSDQPYLVEIWIEKTTMNDVLEPLCQELKVNLVTAAGFQSITSAVATLKRARRLWETGKPCRILYISDFDPGGECMPVSVARQFEFWLDRYAPGADVKLMSLALTREQIERYRLPRTPIKGTDTRKDNFEDRRGEGAVELDALEALHPGALAKIVRKAIAPYRDRELSGNLEEDAEAAQEAAEDAYDEATAEVSAALEEIEDEVRAIAAEFEERLREINKELQERLAPYLERLDSLREAAEEAARNLDVDLPERSEGEPADVDESGWLFDAARECMEQLRHYRRHKGEPEEPRPRLK
jgi:hypothetical protein